MNLWIKSTALLSLALVSALTPNYAMAQSGGSGNSIASSPAADKDDKAPAEQKVSLDLKNAPIREALEKLFRQTKSDFSLDNSVQGYVTLKVTDQPFESALRLLLGRSAVPLTYTKESGVYFIKPRRTRQSAEASEPILSGASASGRGGSSSEQTLIADQDGNRLIAGDRAGGGGTWEVIHLTYLDPADIAQLFNIIQIPTFSRQMGNAGGVGVTGLRY